MNPAAVTLTATAADAGKRLDLFLAAHFSNQSRSRLKDWIKGGRVHVDGSLARPSRPLRGGEVIEVEPAAPPPLRAAAEELPVHVLYEDEDIVAVNKPAGMSVHPGAGCASGTLVNALLHHFASLSDVGGEMRPGIVHRLDKDTSGVLIVARHDAAHRSLAKQFAARRVEKIYVALVEGQLKQDSGRIEKPIARDPVRRVRMTARLGTGREAVTEYKVINRYRNHTYLEVRIGTGRTHQIRVHLASIGHPVAGDRLYGARGGEHGRFFLHARTITFRHPASGDPVTIEAPLAPELERWLEGLL